MNNLDHKKETEGLILHEYWDLAYQAHSGTSFSPEKRATQEIISSSEELENDLKELGENQGNYKEKYIAKFAAWLNAKSRCLSWMIAGPANFPVRRAEKANNSERNKLNELYHWREKYFKAVNRVKTPSPEEDLDDKLKELDKLIISNDRIKSINKIISSGNRKNLTTDEIASNLRESGIVSEVFLQSITDTSGWRNGRVYGIQTLGPKIKKKKETILVLKSRIQRKSAWEDIEFDDGNGTITIEDDRVKIFHMHKPDPEVISKLKSNGFRWSPNWKCWCRKHTGFAVAAAKKICEVK